MRAAAAAACCALGAFCVLAAAGAGATGGVRFARQPTPDPTGSLESELFAVSCASASACIAVGYGAQGALHHVLAERYDGVRWSLAHPIEPAGAVTADLVSVSCTAAAACTAVGNYKSRTGLTLTLAERWNGRRWAIERTLDPGRPYAHPTLDSGTEFGGVSCAAASACVAVGDYLDRHHRSVALAERWNGRRWRLEPTPGAVSSQLGSASCAAPSACVAVGEHRKSFGAVVPLAERWNGHDWKLESTPAATVPGSLTSILVSVSCPSSSACIAVGERSTAAGGHAPFAERRAGGRWSIAATPHRADAAFASVSCSAGDACTAVGLDASSAQPLTERWDGSSWSLQPPAALGRQRTAGALGGVSCPSPAVCEAVGVATYDAGGVDRTLTLAERRGG